MLPFFLILFHRAGKRCRTTQPLLRQVLKIFIGSRFDLRVESLKFFLCGEVTEA